MDVLVKFCLSAGLRTTQRCALVLAEPEASPSSGDGSFSLREKKHVNLLGAVPVPALGRLTDP